MGNLTSGKIITASLYPSTMGEKSEMWSTDRIMGFRKGNSVDWPSSEEQYLNLLANISAMSV